MLGNIVFGVELGNDAVNAGFIWLMLIEGKLVADQSVNDPAGTQPDG